MTAFELASLGYYMAQLSIIAWGIWEMRKSNASREASTNLMIQQAKALEGIGAGIREQSKALEGIGAGIREQSKALEEVGVGIREQSAGIREQSAGLREQSAGIREQSAGIRALLERSASPRQ